MTAAAHRERPNERTSRDTPAEAHARAQTDDESTGAPSPRDAQARSAPPNQQHPDPPGEARPSVIPEALVATAYERLRRIAMTMLNTERDGHTLEPTALVNEALRRILNAEGLDVASDEHLNRLVTVVMRRVLIDHARAYRSRVRRESQTLGTHTDPAPLSPDDADELLALHAAVAQMRHDHPRRAEVLANYYFGGQPTDVIADALSISRRTVQLELALGRHALKAKLKHMGDQGHGTQP